MSLFIGTKVINAVPMNRADYNTFRDWDLPDDENGEDFGYLVEYLDGGKPNIVEYSGYVSWSPLEVFDNAYKSLNALTFGDAIHFAKQGAKIARAGWNGSGMYALIMPGYPEGVLANEATAKVHGVEIGSIIKIQPYWVIVNSQGEVSTWAPSSSDSLAEDWYILE